MRQLQVMNIDITQETAGASKFHLSITETGFGKRQITMFLRTSNSYIEQTTFFFQCPGRISYHPTGKQVFFQTDHKYILKLQSFSRMNCHQRYLFPIIRLVGILIGKQCNLRKEIGKRHIRITLLLPQSAEVIHSIHQLFYIFLTA